MDCRRAAEIVSGARDGEQIPAAEVAQVRQHCAGCAECAALLATMRRMDAVPSAQAPAALVERILAAAQAEADARLDAQAAYERTAPASGILAPLTAARPRTQRQGPAWWQPRFTAYATAAVVVLVVSAASTYTLVQMTRSMSATPAEDSMEVMSTDSWAAGEDAAAADASGRFAEAAAPTLGAVTGAPAYVAWDGQVWIRTDGAPASELTTAGATISDLGEPSGPKERTVLTSASDDATIFVRSSDGTLIRFTRVVRTLGRREYALAAGGSLTTFGAWPSLPPEYATPTADDGSPKFARQGFEDRSLDIFVPPGADVANGFALAPGTPADDPAGGNPYWTWWEPVD